MNKRFLQYSFRILLGVTAIVTRAASDNKLVDPVPGEIKTAAN